SDPQAEQNLIKIAGDELYPISVRATAISFMNRYTSDDIFKIVKLALDDPEPLIRETAARVYSNNDITEYKKDLLKLLNDPVKAVRAEAAIRISELPAEELPQKYKEAFNNALIEYKNMNLYMADFPSGRMNLGLMHANQNELIEAAKQYEEAIKIDSLFFPAKMNLAITYSQIGKSNESEILLRDLIENHPELSDSYYYLGLLLAEKKNYDEAVIYMQKASQLMPERSRINYNSGLMLQYLGRNKEAEAELLLAINKAPNNFDFLYALADHNIKTGQNKKALDIGIQLKQLFPENQMGNDIVNYINNLNNK
ncbi:MAG: tetratricopeptide repeat protein, partial [Melioribacteraceae bacterium]|nr:tetratricopeptide repeat protein [Melioribacteraceae bacterium]